MQPKYNAPLVGIIFFIVIIGMGVFISNTKSAKEFIASFTSSNSQPRLKADSFIPELPGYNKIISSATTDIFISTLDYNPQTNAVFQKSANKGKTDIFYAGLKNPETSSDYFSYKVEVVSPQNTLLQQTWFSTPLLLAKTKNNTIAFQIETIYQKNAIVRVILPNKKIIWTGFIQ